MKTSALLASLAAVGLGYAMPTARSTDTLIRNSKPAIVIDGPQSNSTLSRRSGIGSGPDVFSRNWAGAVMPLDNVNHVGGAFYVPKVSLPPGGDANHLYQGSIWIGIGGTNGCGQLLQAGLDIFSNGKDTYRAWFEYFPDPLTWMDDLTFDAGDLVSIYVTPDFSATGGAATITNISKNKSQTMSVGGKSKLCQNTAEWIVEGYDTDGKGNPMPWFDNFSFVYANAQTPWQDHVGFGDSTQTWYMAPTGDTSKIEVVAYVPNANEVRFVRTQPKS